MKILIVAPLPPPLTGNSLPVKLIYEELKKNHFLEVINLSKKNHVAGIDSLRRVLEIIRVIIKYPFKHVGKDIIYLSIAESKTGNLRDLFIYALSIGKLSKIYIHMLGGAGMNELLEKRNWRFYLNKFFISKIAGVIVEGQVQKDMFSKLINSSRIHIIPNFAQDYLFVDQELIKNKFENISPLKVLFLSNMLPGKGHQELLHAYLSLPEDIKSKIQIDFAGKIVEETWKDFFLNHINNEPNLSYHGSVDGDLKKSLFANSHVFCLPTYYKYEGQPFTIIESYATGNVVITTNHSGISNVFNEQNGFIVKKNSVTNLAETLVSLIHRKDELKIIAQNNFLKAKSKYNQKVFLTNVINLLNSKF